MIRAFRNINKKATTAVPENYALDAAERIGRVIASRHPGVLQTDEPLKGDAKKEVYADFALKFIPNTEHAIIKGKLSGTVVCDFRDTFDRKVGEAEAIKKAKRNHKNAFRRALIRWQVAMLKDVQAVSPETFKEAVHKVMPCDCKCNK